MDHEADPPVPTQTWPKHMDFHMTGPLQAACAKCLMLQQTRPGFDATRWPPQTGPLQAMA